MILFDDDKKKYFAVYGGGNLTRIEVIQTLDSLKRTFAKFAPERLYRVSLDIEELTPPLLWAEFWINVDYEAMTEAFRDFWNYVDVVFWVNMKYDLYYGDPEFEECPFCGLIGSCMCDMIAEEEADPEGLGIDYDGERVY